ncbi:MAG: hypothetical protein AAFV53_10065 [Myxococcota bacterium]
MKRIIVFALLTFSAAALAQQEDVIDEDTRPKTYRQVTELDEDDFKALEMDGELVRPGIIRTQERSPTTFHPMITLRTDFNAEMASSIDDIR